MPANPALDPQVHVPKKEHDCTGSGIGGYEATKRPRQKSVRPLVIAVIVLVVLALQVAPVAADSYLQCSRVGDRVIQGVAETTVPNLDSDDGYFYVVRGAQTSSATRWSTVTPSSYTINSGTLLGTDSLSNMSYSDNVYWNIRSAGGTGYYYPSSYTLLGSTTWKSGSINNLKSNDSQYMYFQSYQTNDSQYGLKFDNTYWMDAGNKASLDLKDPFTIEFRIKWNAMPPQGYSDNIIQKSDGSYGYYLWYDIYTAGKIYLMGQINGNSPFSRVDYEFALTVGVWYHIAWVRNGANMYLYINGIRNSSMSSATTPTSVTDDFMIGYGSSGYYASNYITLDEVAVWKTARWTNSSFTVPKAPYVGNEANLSGLWHMNEGSGNTAYDSSPNSNNAVKGGTGSIKWVEGYKFAGYVKVEFSGSSNLFSWRSLTLTTDLNWNASTVTVTIQLFNYTLGDYSTSGIGYLRYNSSSTPNTDESKFQTITINPTRFRDLSTGAWKVRITGWKGTSAPFQLGADLVEYSPFMPGLDVELVSTVPDLNIKSGISTVNVTIEARCNMSSVTHNLYLFNYTKNAYVFKDSFALGTIDVVRHINITSGAADFISATGEMKIELNSTYSAGYIAGFDLVKWDLRYYEPKWETQWRVDYQTTISKPSITKVSVKLNGNLSRTADVAYLSMYNQSSSSWTQIIRNVNHTAVQVQWYNTTAPLDINRFISASGCLNITMYAGSVNWTAIKSFTDQLAVYVYQVTPDTTPPSTTTDLAATNPTAYSITLTWTAPGDDGNIGVAAGYVVKYSASGPINSSDWGSAITYTQSWAPLPAGSLETHVVSGLQSGTKYWFAIKAYDEVPNYSGVSNSPSGSTTDITPPAPITSLAAKNPTANSITLTWIATGDDGNTGTATGYVIKYSMSGAITNVTWSSATTYSQAWTPLPAGSNETYVISGLSSGTTYWFAIEAYDETPNYGGVSNSPSASTIDITPPAPINDLATSSPTANSITLTWTATGDDGNTGTATGYVVKYSTTGAIDATNWGFATTYIQTWGPLPVGSAENHTVSALTSGTRYWFAVKAYDEVPNYGGVSNSPSASTTDITPPAPITDLYSKNPTGTTITLTWTAVGDDGSVGTASGYVVKYSTTGAIIDANWSSATTYTQSWAPLPGGSNETHLVSGLSSDTKYWFAVKAYDETPNYGGISNSPSASTTDITPPAAIIDLRANNATTDSITLTWTASGDDGNTGTATGYIIKYSTTGPITSSNWDSATTYTQSWVPLANGSVETHIVSGLQSDSQYWFAIKAYDEVPNYSGVSNSPSSPTRDTIPPLAITDLAASNPAVDSITLTWTAPGDDGGSETIAGYVVKYSTSGPITDENWDSATTYIQSWVPLAPGSVETHIVYGLNSSTKYWFAVKAYDETPNYAVVSNSADGTTRTTQVGGVGSLSSLLIVIIPISLIVVASVGVIGLKVMGRSKQVGPKSPFTRRSKVPEGVSRPRLREYVGESGVVAQPKKRAKFEEQGSTEGKERSG